MFRSTRSRSGTRKGIDLREAEGLAAVFDACAPQLLRYAIHLIGDAAEAEDLVQETFVAAIEAADRFDPSRPWEPWLRGILANHARRRMRAGGRRIDVERLLERSGAAPVEDTLGKEQAGELAKAIDRLDEPYRQVVLLRLRHGMSPADIAHLVGESPGTVRVQLHRGIQKTRRLLPAGMVLPLAAWETPARGLEAVREAVLHHAHASALAGASGGLLGGLLVHKTLAAAAAACVLLAALWWTNTRPEDDAQPSEHKGEPVLVGGLTGDSDAKEATPVLVGTGEETTPEVTEIVPTGPTTMLSGTVADGETEAPVQGAILTLHPTQRTTVAALRAQHHETLTQSHDGRVRALGPDALVLDDDGVDARFGQREVDAFVKPARDVPPIARTTSTGTGSFALRMPKGPGMLVVKHPSYGQATVAVVGPEKGYAIRLWPLRRFAARVVDPSGKPVVGMHVIVASLTTYKPAGHVQQQPRAVRVPRAAVTATTDEHGAFEVHVGAQWVRVLSRTPGLRIEKKIDMDGATTPGHGWMTYPAHGKEAPAVLVARPGATLRVTDAATGTPIERFHLRGQTSRENLLWRGRFEAPAGMLSIFDGSPDRQQRAGDASASFRVWAPGYLPERAAFDNLRTAGIVEVALRRGETPAAVGFVLAAGDAVAGATVSLATPSMYWQEGRDTYVATTKTEADGSFRLEAPAGRYLVEVRHGERSHTRIVQVPAPRELEIDLEALAELEVLVVDSHGTPKVDHVVGLHGADGRSGRAYTDERGRLVFDRLSPGTYSVHAPQVSTKGSFAGGFSGKATLTEGGRASVTLTIPAIDGDVFARIVPDTPTDFTTWQARGARDPKWVTMRADGTVPIPLQGGEWRLELKPPDDRRFFVRVPDKPSKSFDVPLTTDGPSYEGVVTDPDGHPWPGIRIVAIPGTESPGQAWGSCVTDAEGRFRLIGSGQGAHLFSFEDHANRNRARFEGVVYRPKGPPGAAGARLRIRLAYAAHKGLGGDTIRLKGTLKRKDGSAYATARIQVACAYPDEHGTLTTYPKTASVRADDDGRFEVTVPPAPRHELSVYHPRTFAAELTSEWILAPGTRKAQRDFVVPAVESEDN